MNVKVKPHVAVNLTKKAVNGTTSCLHILIQALFIYKVKTFRKRQEKALGQGRLFFAREVFKAQKRERDVIHKTPLHVQGHSQL